MLECPFAFRYPLVTVVDVVDIGYWVVVAMTMAIGCLVEMVRWVSMKVRVVCVISGGHAEAVHGHLLSGPWVWWRSVRDWRAVGRRGAWPD